MTRNYILTSSDTHTGTKSRSRGDHRRRALRGLTAVPVALLLAFAPAVPAAAAGTTGNEGLSGYKHTEKAKKETLPAKTSKEPTPAKAVEPTTTSEAVKTTEPVAKAAKTLPFTGYNLNWTVGVGVVLVAAGGSIILMQRRRRSADR